ncbi:MAG: SpoIIE family protein phosphatase [Bacteroidales bacterium]|nr:SpoIIE family protein phosphatase [Bacteroidales bacterium]
MKLIRAILTIAMMLISAINTTADDAGMHTIDSLKNELKNAHEASRFHDTYDIAIQILTIQDTTYKAQLNVMLDEASKKMGLDKLKAENDAVRAQKRMWVFISIAVTLAAIVSLVGLNLRRSKSKRAILSSQKEMLEEEVRKQMEIIEETNRSLTNSISYAQHIQEAILPPDDKLRSCGVSGAFAFYQPLNVVSGDFYWAETRQDEMLVACADCTGHGVPGAFMSLIGTTLLNDICSELEDWDPGHILTELDNRLIDILRQNNNSSIQDGMDTALISYSSASNKLRMASARRSILYFHGSDLTEYKGTKRSIGDQEEFRERYTFDTTELTVNKGDTIYLSSDGLSDQFGGQSKNGEKGRKLMNSGAKKMICELNTVGIKEQKEHLTNLFNNWKGTCMQVDDVSIVGIRF